MNTNQETKLAFSKSLQRILKQRNISMTEAASYAKASKSVVHNWLSGATPHDLEAVARLASALQVPMYELLFGQPEPILAKQLNVLFHKEELFSGLCELTIKKLVPITQIGESSSADET